MTKPKRIGPKKLGLSKAVKEALAEKGGTPLEHHFVFMDASGHLLERLRLPKEKLAKAKQLEAHSQRLLEAETRVLDRIPMTIKTARKIIEVVLEEMPGFIERHNDFEEKQTMGLQTLKENLEKDLQHLKDVPDKLPTTLSPQFLNDARNIHFDELKHLLGEKNFKLYTNAMRRTMKALRWRKRK